MMVGHIYTAEQTRGIEKPRNSQQC